MAFGGPSEDHHTDLEDDKLLNPYIDSSDFETVSKSPAFVDKTMFIQEFLRYPSTYILITAPSGFGKSTNLDMIKRFAELNIDKTTGKIGSPKESVNYKLFKKSRLISREKDFINKYFGQYAVIHLSLNDVHGNNMESLMDTYSQALSKTFSEHKYLLNSNQITVEEKEYIAKYMSFNPMQRLSKFELQTGIGYLAHILSKHCKNYKIIAFVDDYDAPLLKFLTDENISNDYEDQFAKFFQNIYAIIMLLKKDIIHRALITGVTTLAWTTLFPQNITILLDRFLHHGYFSDYYGLTIKEIAALLYKFAIDIANIKPIITHYGHISLQSDTIVSTRSLMYYLNSKVFNDYYDYPRIANTIRLQTAIRSTEIRYIIDKTLLDVPFISTLFDKPTLHGLRLYQLYFCENSSWPSALLYIEILTEFGFFYIGKKFGKLRVRGFTKAENEHVRRLLQNEMEHFYSTELNNLLILGAEHLNRLSISSNTDYFSKFADILKPIYTLWANRDAAIINKNMYNPFIAILGKSKYNYINKFFDNFEGILIDKRYNLVFCIMSHSSNARVKLEELIKNFEKRLKHPEFRPLASALRDIILLAINFDDSFAFTFKLVKKNDKFYIDFYSF